MNDPIVNGLPRDLQDVAKRMYEEDKECYELFKDLFNSPQWRKLDEIGTRLIRKYEVDIVYADEPHHERNIKRGMCKGIMLMLDLPDLLFAQGAHTIEQVKESQNDSETDND